MLKKINLPILLVIMCILMSVVLGLEYLEKNQKKPNDKETKITRTDYSETARKTLDWIDKQRNESDWYILERGCDYQSKTCDIVWDNEEGNKDGLIATWVRLNFYEQTKNPKDLEIVKKDIDVFYNKYKNDNLKDSLWICKITYEMAQSKYLNTTEKTKLEEICFYTDFPTPEEVKTYWQTEKEEKLAEMGEGKDVWKTWNGYILAIRGFDASLGYSSDMAYRYLWKKNNTDLEQAKKYLAVVQEIYKSETINIFGTSAINKPEDICLMGMSALDIYESGGKDKTVLDFVNKLYDEKVSDPKGELEYHTPICGLLLKRFYKLTSDKKYLEVLETNNRVLKNLYQDGENTKMVSDFGFFKADRKNQHSMFKNIAENGLIVGGIRN